MYWAGFPIPGMGHGGHGGDHVLISGQHGDAVDASDGAVGGHEELWGCDGAHQLGHLLHGVSWHSWVSILWRVPVNAMKGCVISVLSGFFDKFKDRVTLCLITMILVFYDDCNKIPSVGKCMRVFFMI